MCLNPILIPNPNYKKDCSKRLDLALKDCTHQRIYVPCGHCAECIASKQMQLVQRVQMEATKNHVFFSSLTYNNSMLPHVEVNGHSIRYADVADVQKMMKRLRKTNAFGRPFRYFAVSELGSKKGRPHFHILWLIPKMEGDDYYTLMNLEKTIFNSVLFEWRRNVGSNRKPVYKPLCDYVVKTVRGRVRSTYDTHYVNPALSANGESDVAFYVLKYMLKPSDRAARLQQALKLNLDEVDYNQLWNIVKPRYFKSLDFGLSRDKDVENYLRGCVESSFKDFEYPVFVNPINGQTFPLSRFYKSKGNIYSLDDALTFYYNKDSKFIDSPQNIDYKSYREAKERTKKRNKDLALVESHFESFDFCDDLF